MAKLTTEQRKKLPKRDFAGAGESYPVNDRAHAANAKARATQMEKAGKLSKSAEEKIDAKANKVLDDDDGKMKRHMSRRDDMRRSAAGRVRVSGN